MKLNESMIKEICNRHGLTFLEGTVITFLFNNPTLDTAGDIAEVRRLSKGNVSQAVESLVRRGLLKRNPDPEDRRKIHLALLPASRPVTDEIRSAMERFHQELYHGITPEEQALYADISKRIFQNTQSAMTRRDLT